MSLDKNVVTGGLAEHEAIISMVRNRFDIASKKILESPKFDDESRELATNQATVYMLAVSEVLKVPDNLLTEDSKKLVAESLCFCDLVDSFCAD